MAEKGTNSVTVNFTLVNILTNSYMEIDSEFSTTDAQDHNLRATDILN